MTYVRLTRGQGRPKTFERAALRPCGYVIDVCGDKPLPAYTKADANGFRDALIERGLHIFRTLTHFEPVPGFGRKDTTRRDCTKRLDEALHGNGLGKMMLG